MVHILDTTDHDFSTRLVEQLAVKQENSPKIAQVVQEIIEHVRQNGDASLIEYTHQLDNFSVKTIDGLRVSDKQLDQADQQVSDDLLEAMHLAANRIRDFHERQMPKDLDFIDGAGVRLGARWAPVEGAGIYVPGGQAVYPSSVLMNAIPARVAGVERIVMVVPTPHGILEPALLVAAKLAGISEIYTIGGAQAIAALAYGTETIAKVDVVVGPGNAYVAAAKRQVYGQVGIDMIAGPSEILVVADDSANPAWVAADLLSQAEHDRDARAMLVTADPDYAQAVIAAVEQIIPELDRAEIARDSWTCNGLVVLCQDEAEIIQVINQVAPEHLALMVHNPEALLPGIKNAGAVFLGHYTPEAIGDYVAGPSHVLPTASTARFSSALSVFDFLKRQSLIGCSKEAFHVLAPATSTFAKAEGLGAHALSVDIRGES